MKTALLPALLLFFCSCQSTNAPQKNQSSSTSSDTLALAQPASTDTMDELAPVVRVPAQTVKQEFKKPQGIQFAVSNVTQPKDLLPTYEAKALFEQKTNRPILFFPESQQNYSLVACDNHGLLETIHICFDEHRPLLLSPDAIWLTICQGVSIHINENFKTLSPKIFKAGKPDKLVVRNDNLEAGARHWADLMASLAGETQKYTQGDFYSFFVPKFTTTTPECLTAYQITLLESYKKAFRYIGETGCGIPSVTLTGTREDWQRIYDNLEQLEGLEMEPWAATLRPVIQEFINVFDGKTNPVFWQSIYKDFTEYNAFYISGWVLKFFPYIKEHGADGPEDPKTGERKVTEFFKPNPFLEGDRYLMSTLSTDNFPSGIAAISILWRNHNTDKEQEMPVTAGFFAIKQYPDKTLEPFISWAIHDPEKVFPNYVFENSRPESQGLAHRGPDWSPNFAAKVSNPAIYDARQFKTQAQSLAFIKQILQDSLRNMPELKGKSVPNVTVTWVVLSNGSVTDVVVRAKADPAISAKIREILTHLPQPWLPALAFRENVTDAELDERQMKEKMVVNSAVKIELSVQSVIK